LLAVIGQGAVTPGVIFGFHGNWVSGAIVPPAIDLSWAQIQFCQL
jgi:hypothetical protein